MEVHGRQPHNRQDVDRLRHKDEARSDVKPGHAGEAHQGSSAEKATDRAGGSEPHPVQRHIGGRRELTSDVLEFSGAAEALNDLEDNARAEHVLDLKRQFEDGSLLTADRLEKAALGILRG